MRYRRKRGSFNLLMTDIVLKSNPKNTADDADDEDDVFTNGDGYAFRQQDSGDEEEEEPTATGTVAHEGVYMEESETDSDTEPPEWEIGIRRSSKSKGTETVDLTLEDIILDPDGNVAYYWLCLVAVSITYNIAVVILRLAFSEMREPAYYDSIFYALDTFSDIVYLLDIALQYKISYYEEGCLVLDPDKINQRYMGQPRFIFDVIAVLPYGSVLGALSVFTSLVFLDLSEIISDELYVLIVRVPRLLKVKALVRFFDITDSRTSRPNAVRAFKLTMNLWIVIHWIGCFYYMLSEYEGLGSNEWVYPNGTDYNTFQRKYIRIMYWSLMTLTTIGERPAPETDLEYVFTGVTFLIGVFVFAAVVGNVGDVISNMNAARQDFQSRMDQIKFYLHHRRVPDKLQNKVKRWADYTWTRTQAIDEANLLQMLPDRLRTEIAINVHLETLKKVKIFEECEEGLLRELVLKLRPQIYSPGDYICRTGEIGREMFIVNHGKVEILVPNSETGRRMVVAMLHPGNYFGEISLLKLDDGQNRRTADVKSVGYSELLRLSRKDLMTALVEYPNAKKILETQAKERMQKTKQVRKATQDESSSQEFSVSEEKPRRSKDVLMHVIKSDSFQKLLSSKNNETNELRRVLQELKSFDSQITKQKLEAATEETAQLKRQLQQKNAELETLKRKLSKLDLLIPDRNLHNGYKSRHRKRRSDINKNIEKEVCSSDICHCKCDTTRQMKIVNRDIVPVRSKDSALNKMCSDNNIVPVDTEKASITKTYGRVGLSSTETSSIEEQEGSSHLCDLRSVKSSRLPNTRVNNTTNTKDNPSSIPEITVSEPSPDSVKQDILKFADIQSQEEAIQKLLSMNSSSLDFSSDHSTNNTDASENSDSSMDHTDVELEYLMSS